MSKCTQRNIRITEPIRELSSHILNILYVLKLFYSRLIFTQLFSSLKSGEMFQFPGAKLHFSSKNKKIIEKYLFWKDMKKEKNQGQKVDAPTPMAHSLSNRPVQYYSVVISNGGNQEETWAVNILSTLISLNWP